MIESKIPIFIKELNEKINILENKGIALKKTDDRVNLIVKENLNYYIIRVRRFIEDINNIEKENLEKFNSRINKIFLDFNEKSQMSYQKITLLIGNEAAAIREHINDSSKTISFIESNLENFNNIKNTISKVDERIMFLGGKIKKIEGTDKKILEEVDKIKKSDNHIENLKKQEEIKLIEDELEKEIYKLRELIDFKLLGNIFHISKGKMDIVKAYKEDFQTNFQKNNGVDILKLLNEAKLNTEMILVKIKQINDKKEKIIKNKETINKNETDDLLSKSRDIKLEIENLNNEKVKELKKYEKFEANKENIINSIKQEIIKLNVIIE